MRSAPAPKPFNEQYRQQVLDNLCIVDSEPAPEFDRVVWLAQRYFGTKFSLVTLIDNDRQWFLADCGLNGSETPRDDAFCAHAIMEQEVMVVLDASKDPRFMDNPLVTGPPAIRFYAGAPITIDDVAIGTLCIVDDETREQFDQDAQASLSAFSRIIEDEIKLRRHLRATTTSLKTQLDEANQLAGAGNAAKQQFLALISHEMRTPLNAIIGFSECISEGIMGPVQPIEYKEFAENISTSGKRYLGLINRILRFADQGDIRAKDTTFNIGPLVLSCIEVMGGEVTHAGLRISQTLPDADISFKGDKYHIQQLLLELIGNAIKFTSRGGQICIDLSIDVEKCVSIAVSDTGIGIDPDKIQTAISAFSQLSTGLGRNFEGAGIGLPIANKLAEMHGATLSFSNRDVGGTCVEVRFPNYRTVDGAVV